LDNSKEVPGRFVATSCDTSEILEPAEATLDNIAPFIGTLAETAEGHLLDLFGTTGFALRNSISDACAFITEIDQALAVDGEVTAI
jgi:hypothetical protein